MQCTKHCTMLICFKSSSIMKCGDCPCSLGGRVVVDSFILYSGLAGGWGWGWGHVPHPALFL